MGKHINNLVICRPGQLQIYLLLLAIAIRHLLKQNSKAGLSARTVVIGIAGELVGDNHDCQI